MSEKLTGDVVFSAAKTEVGKLATSRNIVPQNISAEFNTDRLRKLERIAVEAYMLMSFYRLFGKYSSPIGEYADAMDTALDALGEDEMQRLRFRQPELIA